MNVRSNRGELINNEKHIYELPQRIKIKQTRYYPNSCLDIYHEEEYVTDKFTNCALITDSFVTIRKNSIFEYQVFEVQNINNRLTLKPVDNHCKFNNDLEWYARLVVYGDFELEDIIYYVNRLYGKPYEHEKLYLPPKQDISDFIPINEEEILGENTNEFEDNNDNYDMYFEFFGCDMRDVKTIEDNIFDWLKI